MMRKGLRTLALFLVCVTVAAFGAPSTLENPQPGSYQSGIGLLSGWSCQGPNISIVIDGLTYLPAYGTPRTDTAAVCGSGNTDTGFGYLFNFNLLGSGVHYAQLFVNGAPSGGSVAFTVTVPVSEYARGLSKTITVQDFPAVGETTTFLISDIPQRAHLVS